MPILPLLDEPEPQHARSVGDKKANGVYYTPPAVASTLVRWARRRDTDQMLDPSCGDGQFIACHAASTGVERDPSAALRASHRTQGAVIHVGDFFEWSEQMSCRFDFAAGNPPFIRYQRFTGEVRQRSLAACRRFGVGFSSLASSWASFLVVSASLLKRGGRMAFVVPAEIGHAPYAAPLLRFLAHSFDRVQLVAVRERLFPDISQDIWLLYSEGYGGSSDTLGFTRWDRFEPRSSPPKSDVTIPISEWERWRCRLRPFLVTAEVRDLYMHFATSASTVRFGDIARIGIGYVTGANDFFHLRPSVAMKAGIPARCLVPAVRNGRVLPPKAVTKSTVDAWRRRDDACLLLRLAPKEQLDRNVARYLDSSAGQEARQAYKCRTRSPWYVVPHVYVPDAFLTYMNGTKAALVANHAQCVCTNSVHAVRLQNGVRMGELRRAWEHPLTALSVEMEGHPLGGGMLKLEPGEAARILLATDPPPPDPRDEMVIADGVRALWRWRHHG